MIAREAVLRIQEDRVEDATIGGFLSQESILRVADASSLARWIVSTPPPNRGRTRFVEALRADNRELTRRSHAALASVEAIASGGRVVVVSHQPTMLPYTGVFAQFLLAQWLASRLTATDGRPATVVYLCLDSDDALDRRIKTAHVPMPVAREGQLSISASIPSALQGHVQHRVPGPGPESLASWVASLRGAFGRCAGLVPHLRGELFAERERIVTRLVTLCRDVISHPGMFSDFSRAVLLDFVEEVSGQRPLFLRLSTACTEGRETLEGLLNQFHEIRPVAAEARSFLAARGVALRSPSLLAADAAWSVCDACGRRTPLDAETATQLLTRNQSICCKSCSTQTTAHDSPACVVPRILVEDLFGSTFTDASIVLTYAGSAEHVLLAQWTFREVLCSESPIYTWHPQHHLGDVLENASIALCADTTATHSDATSALRLAWNGRDSLVHCLGTLDLRAYNRSWGTFFGTQRLTEPMVFGEPAHNPAPVTAGLS